MGVPKRLTEMQQKFAHLLVTNEGRMTGYECAKEAGYSEDRARQTSSELHLMTQFKHHSHTEFSFMQMSSTENEIFNMQY